MRLENKAISNINTEVFSQLQPDQYGPQEVARLVQRFQSVNDGSVRSHLAILQARKILEQADALVVQFDKTIADANESQEKGIDRMVGRAGMRNPALVQALVGQASEKMQARLGEIFGDESDADSDGKPDPVAPRVNPGQ